jgi:hypothetical protein
MLFGPKNICFFVDVRQKYILSVVAFYNIAIYVKNTRYWPGTTVSGGTSGGTPGTTVSGGSSTGTPGTTVSTTAGGITTTWITSTTMEETTGMY